MSFEEKINDYASEKKNLCIANDSISDTLFREYGVNRGLRDQNGKGVLTGLTNISNCVLSIGKRSSGSMRRAALVPRIQRSESDTGAWREGIRV